MSGIAKGGLACRSDLLADTINVKLHAEMTLSTCAFGIERVKLVETHQNLQRLVVSNIPTTTIVFMTTISIVSGTVITINASEQEVNAKIIVALIIA